MWDGTPIRLLGVRCTKLTEEKIEPKEEEKAPAPFLVENEQSGQITMDFLLQDSAGQHEAGAKTEESDIKHQKGSAIAKWNSWMRPWTKYGQSMERNPLAGQNLCFGGEKTSPQNLKK